MPYHQCITHTYHILRGEGEACIIFSLNDFTLLDRMTYFWIEWPIFGQNVLFLDRMSYFWMECPDRKASDLQFNWFSWLICADNVCDSVIVHAQHYRLQSSSLCVRIQQGIFIEYSLRQTSEYHNRTSFSSQFQCENTLYILLTRIGRYSET